MVVKRFSCVGGEGGIIWRNCSFGIIRVRVVQRERERERERLWDVFREGWIRTK